ncbi:oligosaccharide flippase family protein [Tenacibaculum agarivorans]|uniref:oligosaccharide flippase family protein n=1 Tax=Tenacibaculum agarivorans TaxID=1908389 RepID=UPI00094B82A9|nr:lipopolysaccharide biosynthesis protein [Tenacibaculum agarivorans]
MNSLSSNFIWLSLIRFFNILSKFIITAFLIRVLGELNYGIITWSDAVLQYFIVFINFGFNIYGIKTIADSKGDVKLLQKNITSIYVIKILLFFFSFFILGLLQVSNLLKADYLILFLLLTSTIGDVLFPIWYFQGIEKIKPIGKIVLITKTFLIVCVLLLINNINDIYKYIFIYTMSQIILGALGYIQLKKEIGFNLRKTNKEHTLKIFSSGKYFLLGNFSMLVFNALTIFLIGIFSSMEDVSGFDISLKLVMFSIIPIEILQAISLPILSKNKSLVFLKKIILITISYSLITFILVRIFSSQLMLILGGEDIIKYSYLIKELSYLVLFVPMGYIIGQCTLVAFNAHKSYNFSLVLVAIVYIITIVLLFYFKAISFQILIRLRIFSDLFLFAILVLFIFKHKIFANAKF